VGFRGKGEATEHTSGFLAFAVLLQEASFHQPGFEVTRVNFQDAFDRSFCLFQAMTPSYKTASSK